MPTGSRRLAQKKEAIATGSPAMAPRFKPSTKRSPKPMRPPCLSVFANFWRSFTAHSRSPVATIRQPAIPERKNSARSSGSPKRAMCRP